MKALVLAAGEGTRLRPLTLDKPKPMLPINGKPLLAITVEQLRQAGIKDIAFNVYYHPEAITDYFGNGRSLDVNITYSYEEKLLGTAGAAKKLESFLDETFVLVYGDVLTNVNYGRLLDFHHKHDALVTLALYRVDNPTEVGLVETDTQNRVIRFLEKPEPEEVFTDLANAGVLICDPQILAQVPPATFYDFGHDLLPKLLKMDEPLYALPLNVDEYLIDMGTPEKYQRAQIEWRQLGIVH